MKAMWLCWASVSVSLQIKGISQHLRHQPATATTTETEALFLTLDKLLWQKRLQKKIIIEQTCLYFHLMKPEIQNPCRPSSETKLQKKKKENLSHRLKRYLNTFGFSFMLVFDTSWIYCKCKSCVETKEWQGDIHDDLAPVSCVFIL